METTSSSKAIRPQPADPSEFVGVRIDPERRRGRGAETNQSGRFEKLAKAFVDDGWGSLDLLPALKTEVQIENARKIITRNESPDISFDRSINPYRGCEHGCAYCFARPTHAYMGLSPGLDFETKLFAKPNAATSRERLPSAPTPIPTSRSSGATGSCARSSKCSTGRAIRSASSPSRRW
jgi:hypothetical protein